MLRLKALTDNDAHMYRVRLPQDGQVRIDLTSAEADPYVHLMDEDGTRIAHDDDTTASTRRVQSGDRCLLDQGGRWCRTLTRSGGLHALHPPRCQL